MLPEIDLSDAPPPRKNGLLTNGMAAASFWSNVNKTSTCWLWARPCRSKQGPRYRYEGQDVKIARLAFLFTHGFWPTGGAVRTCANHALCCRPSHIMDIPQKNVPEFLKVRGRHRYGVRPTLTICKRGHPMEGDNVVHNGFQRYCRTCRNLRNRMRHARLRARGLNPRRVHG